MNWIGLYTIIKREIDRTGAVLIQAVLSPVVTTMLYFVVFGAAIGSRITLSSVHDVTYAQFIVPGLIVMALTTNTLTASSTGIYMQKFVGAITELLAAPLSHIEIAGGYVTAAVARGALIGVIIFGVSWIFTGVTVAHPFFTVLFALLAATVFALAGFAIGLWARDFESLSLVPTLIITPMAFLGGVFYTPDMLPAFWRGVTIVNPLFYIVDALRWGFFDTAHISPVISMPSSPSLPWHSLAPHPSSLPPHHTGAEIKRRIAR